MTQFTAPTIIIVQPVYVVVRVWRFSARGQNVSLIPPPPQSLGSKNAAFCVTITSAVLDNEKAPQQLLGKYYYCFEIGYLSFLKVLIISERFGPEKL